VASTTASPTGVGDNPRCHEPADATDSEAHFQDNKIYVRFVNTAAPNETDRTLPRPDAIWVARLENIPSTLGLGRRP